MIVAVSALKFRQVIRYRIVHADLALLKELHNGGQCRDDLCQRGGIEDRVYRHRLMAWNQGSMAICLSIDNLAAVSDNQHCAGYKLLLHRFVQRLDQAAVRPSRALLLRVEHTPATTAKQTAARRRKERFRHQPGLLKLSCKAVQQRANSTSFFVMPPNRVWLNPPSRDYRRSAIRGDGSSFRWRGPPSP